MGVGQQHEYDVSTSAPKEEDGDKKLERAPGSSKKAKKHVKGPEAEAFVAPDELEAEGEQQEILLVGMYTVYIYIYIVVVM